MREFIMQGLRESRLSFLRFMYSKRVVEKNRKLGRIMTLPLIFYLFKKLGPTDKSQDFYDFKIARAEAELESIHNLDSYLDEETYGVVMNKEKIRKVYR